MTHTTPSTASIELFTCKHPDEPDHTSLLVWRHDTHHIMTWHPQGRCDIGQDVPRLHDGLSTEAKLRDIYYNLEDHRLQPAPLLPGEYHPRVWRNGISSHCVMRSETRTYYNPPDFEELRSRVISLHRIQRLLAEVFEVVTPCAAHHNVSGGAMRQVLLLAAVEVEGLLKGAYQANANASTQHTNIDTYSRLLIPMHLDEWELSYSFYDASARRPFHGWRQGSAPTWWRAYNRLKHEPTNTASLGDALDCCLAVRALIEAQFGPYCDTLLPAAGLATIDVTKRPQWRPDELYYPPTAQHSSGTHRQKLLF